VNAIDAAAKQISVLELSAGRVKALLSAISRKNELSTRAP